MIYSIILGKNATFLYIRKKKRYFLYLLSGFYQMGCDSSSAVAAGQPETRVDAYQQPVRRKEAPEPILFHPQDLEEQIQAIPQSQEASLGGVPSEVQKGKLKQAQKHFKSSKLQASISLCEQIIKGNPNNHKALNQLGLCYYYQQRYDQSVQSYKKALEVSPKNDRYWFNLGKSYYYLEDYPESIESYLKSIEINSKSAQCYYDLGRSHYYNYQYSEGIEAYQKGLKLKPPNQEAFYHQIGLCYYYLEDYDKAIEAFKEALEVKPTSHESLNHMGLCYYYKEDYQAAEELYKKALEMAPNNISYLWNQGRNYYWKEDYFKAIETYKICSSIAPNDGSYQAQISMCYFYLKDYWIALEWIDSAIQKIPNQAFVYYRKGNIYYYLQDYNESLLWHQKCLSLNEKNFNGTLGMANAYYYMKNYPKAIEWYLRCIDLNSQNGQVFERLAKSYYFNNQFQESLKYFDDCIRLRPQYIEPLILKGRSLFNMGRYQDSLLQLQKSKKLAESIKAKNPQNYVFYINTINDQIQAGEEFMIKAKLGTITEQDREDIEKMRKSFENKIQKLFTFKLKDDKDKKSKKENVKTTINKDILEIVQYLASKEELYNFKDMAVLTKICNAVKKMFLKDVGYFQILAYIFGVFAWINKFKKNTNIQGIEMELSKKIKYLSVMNPPTQPNLDADLQVQFPLYPQKKINLFKDKKYFQSYSSLIKELQRVNETASADLAPFKELLYQVQKDTGGTHAKANMKLPARQECKDEATYQQKLFKVLLRIFQKMFKDELRQKKQQMLDEIEQQVSKAQRMSIQQIIIVMMGKWISYIDAALKERSQNKVPTQCFITDLVRGKCMYKDTESIKCAVCSVIKICKEKSYEITQLDNRLIKETQDVVMKIKIKNCVSELQLALEFDPMVFEFGHSFYEIERCSLGCIFGCSLFLTKEVNQTFPELLFQNEQATKRAKNIDKSARSALEFVIKELMESVKA